MKNFRSYGFWTALAGAVVVLLNAVGKCFGFTIEEQIVTDIIMAVAGLLVVFGVVSMPKKDEDKKTSSTEEDDEVKDVADENDSENESKTNEEEDNTQ